MSNRKHTLTDAYFLQSGENAAVTAVEKLSTTYSIDFLALSCLLASYKCWQARMLYLQADSGDFEKSLD